MKSQNSQPESQPSESTTGSRPIRTSPTQQAESGERIGKYEVIHEIGRGGMSIVYKARDHELNRLVAIKLMLSKASNQNLNMLRFQQEARAASQLEHPNIVKVHDFSTTDDGTPYLVMSYLDGISLADAIKTEGNFPLGRWLSVMIQACDALEHAHLAGIVHRDIKPSNFVLAQENGVEVLKLVDFGIAKNSSDDMGLTKTGEVFGSPLYMSPEQCAGAKLDSRSDIYSLGCVMYEALAGKPPISGGNSLETMQKHLIDKPDRLSKLKLNIEKIQLLDPIVMRCLEKKPDDRYQNLGELKTELELLKQKQNIRSPKPSAINIPIVVASLVGCAAIFATFLAFDRFDNGRLASLRAHNAGAGTASQKATDSQPQKESEDVAMAPDTPPSLEREKAKLQELITTFLKLRHQRSFAEALAVAESAAKLAKKLNIPPFEQAHIHEQEAEIELRLEHPKAAAEHFRKAVELMANPRIPADYEHKYQTLMAYGNNLRESGQNQKAKISYQEAADTAAQQRNKQHESASLIYMGICEKENNDDNQCLRYWKQAYELNPTDTSLQKNIEDIERRLH